MIQNDCQSGRPCNEYEKTTLSVVTSTRHLNLALTYTKDLLMVPDFDTAVERYRAFLSKAKMRTEIVWVFREDAIANKLRIRLKVPVPAENEPLARRLYSIGQDRGLGICIQTLCLLDCTPCCYIWVPENALDAEHGMLSGLKLSIPDPPIHARAVRSSLRWNLNQYFAGRSNIQWMIDQLPSRADVREVDLQTQ